MKTKAIFKRFLIGYVSNGATVTNSALKEIDKLTDEFLDDIIADYYFNEITVIDYVESMRERLSDKNVGFFKLGYRKRYYIDALEKYIKFERNP